MLWSIEGPGEVRGRGWARGRWDLMRESGMGAWGNVVKKCWWQQGWCGRWWDGPLATLMAYWWCCHPKIDSLGVLLKSFPDICNGAIAGVRILVKSSLIDLGPHMLWPQIDQTWNVGTLGAPLILGPSWSNNERPIQNSPWLRGSAVIYICQHCKLSHFVSLCTSPYARQDQIVNSKVDNQGASMRLSPANKIACLGGLVKIHQAQLKHTFE